MPLVSDLSVLFVTTTPIWAFLLSRFKVEKRWLYAVILAGIGFLMYIALNYFVLLKISRYTWLYLLFLPIYMVTVGWKIGFQQPLKTFSYALMLIFVAADLWELPVFALGALNIKFQQYFDLFYQVHHLYILAVFVLFAKTTRFQISWKTILTICAMLLVVTGLLIFYTGLAARLFTLALFGYIVFEGLK